MTLCYVVQCEFSESGQSALSVGAYSLWNDVPGNKPTADENQLMANPGSA